MMFFISLVHPAPRCDVQIKDVLPGPCVPLEYGVLHFAIAVFAFVSAGAEILTEITQTRGRRFYVRQFLHGFKIFKSQLFASAYLFGGSAEGQGLVISKNDVRAQTADDLANVVVKPTHDGRNTDDNGYTNDDSEHRECRPHFIGANRVQRHLHDLAVIASSHHDKSMISQPAACSASHLKAQCSYRIQPSRPSRRIHAKKETHARRHQQARSHRPQLDCRRHSDNRGNPFGEGDAKQYPQQSANQCHGARFDEELHQHVLAPRAHCLADADLARPLGDGNQHDVHDHDTAHDQRNGCDRDHRNEERTAKVRPEAEKTRVGFSGKAVRPARKIVAAGAQDGAGFVNGGLQLRADTVGLAGDPYAGMRAELFQISGDRDCHIIVTALPQRRTLLFANPNYAIDLAFYANFLVQGICARKKIVHNVGPNDGQIGTVGLIIIVKHAARSQIHIENGSHGRRQSSYPGVADGLLSIFDVTAGIEGRRPEHHAMPAFLEDGLIVVHSQILALLAFEKLVDVGDDGTDFTDDENVSAQIKDLLCHV